MAAVGGFKEVVGEGVVSTQLALAFMDFTGLKIMHEGGLQSPVNPAEKTYQNKVIQNRTYAHTGLWHNVSHDLALQPVCPIRPPAVDGSVHTVHPGGARLGPR